MRITALVFNKPAFQSPQNTAGTTIALNEYKALSLESSHYNFCSNSQKRKTWQAGATLKFSVMSSELNSNF